MTTPPLTTLFPRLPLQLRKYFASRWGDRYVKGRLYEESIDVTVTEVGSDETNCTGSRWNNLWLRLKLLQWMPLLSEPTSRLLVCP